MKQLVLNKRPARQDLPFLQMLSMFICKMQKGFNSDLQVRGKNYHIQTEDWGEQNPFVVTRVFCSGAVLKTIKTPYTEALRGGPAKISEAVKLALRQQHQRTLDQLLAGQLDTPGSSLRLRE